ncbi:hypothetical protein CYLTODRAFT_381079 [Cylindrobasidium torrendii FP15055 ss-10]|uniref:Glyoxylate reductase n=1 Tax=Cylindrobasidium torrendii FP15055 ss-10 TaxID=1314674 RepID=A0A0D7B1E2_9AGAR|nr:hypothetical protein CYLTODRAFT_381079 [Cylindrobasidium torrendii FP15055 ss-10]
MSSSSKPRVVVTRSLGPQVMGPFEARGDVEVDCWPEDTVVDRAWLLEHVKGAAGLLVAFGEKVNTELLDAAGPSLKVVSTMSVGYDHFDVPEIKKRGIKMGYTPGVLTNAVADLTILLILMASRNAGYTSALVQRGDWPSSPWSPYAFCGPQLSTIPSSPKRTIGFLGFGRIAQATLTRLIAFGVTDVVYTTRSLSADKDAEYAKQFPTLNSIKGVSLEDMAKQSDIVVLLAPGGDATYHMIGEAFLRQMKPTAILVNAGRGTVVDSDALAKALKEGWLCSAGLDVVEGEPNVGKDHPLVKEAKCVILPHLGSATIETRLGMANLAVQNVLGGLGLCEMGEVLDP